jgi:vancomycin resistance protein YoaR
MAGQRKWWLAVGFLSVVFLLAVMGGGLWYLGEGEIFTEGLIVPGVKVGMVDIGGESILLAQEKLQRYGKRLLRRRVQLQPEEGEILQPTLAELGIYFDWLAVIAEAEKVGHRGGWWERVGERLQALAGARHFSLPVHINEARLQEYFVSIFGTLLSPPQNATWQLRGGRFVLVPARAGRTVDLNKLRPALLALVRGKRKGPLKINMLSLSPEVTNVEAVPARQRAEALLKHPFEITVQVPRLVQGKEGKSEERNFRISRARLREWLEFVVVAEDPNNPAGNKILAPQLNANMLRSYLKNKIAPRLERPAVNARFVYNPRTRRASMFALGQEGIELEINQSVEAIQHAVRAGKNTATLILKVTLPRISHNTDLERLGIRTLLAEGVSDFKGSPKNRVHNIKIGASKYHGLLIAPGEEFSFNAHLGEVNAKNGYLPELVIKENVTTPEYGGGLCQVSTTMFRAAVRAGLKITARKNHSYPVIYYGTPGFDATVYRPYPDLRFVNDTPGYILIQTRIEGTKLIFAFYGTDDGRQVRVVGPHTYGRKPDGSVKATLAQEIYHNGTLVRRDVFRSAYKSPKLFPRARAANREQQLEREKQREKEKAKEKEKKKKRGKKTGKAKQKPKTAGASTTADTAKPTEGTN